MKVKLVLNGHEIDGIVTEKSELPNDYWRIEIAFPTLKKEFTHTTDNEGKMTIGAKFEPSSAVVNVVVPKEVMECVPASKKATV